MREAGSKAALIGGIGPLTYAGGCLMLALVAIAMIGLAGRARSPRIEFTGALFLVGFAALFAWQIGGFVRRNRPRIYTFDQLARRRCCRNASQSSAMKRDFAGARGARHRGGAFSRYQTAAS